MNPYDYNRCALQDRRRSRAWAIVFFALAIALFTTAYAIAGGGGIPQPTPVQGSGHFRQDSECPVRWVWDWVKG